MSWERARLMSITDAVLFAEPFYPYVHTIADDNPASYGEVRAWCLERFGECGSRRPKGYLPRGMGRTFMHGDYKIILSAQWLQLADHFAFKEANAAFEFKMRWG